MKKSPVGEKPSGWWYLLPIFLSIIGGVIGYFLLKDRDRKFAERLLIIGIIVFVVLIILQIIFGILIYWWIGRGISIPS